MTRTIIALNEHLRPKAPPIAGATDAHRQHGRRLSLYHQMHLAEFARVETVIARIEQGLAAPAEAGEAISELAMAENYRRFGALCGRECQMLTMHHTIEDEHMFPALASVSEGIGKVVAKLAEEHLVIHEMLVVLEAQAIALIEDPSEKNFSAIRETVTVLGDMVRSHFGYEERELEEAIGVSGLAL